MEIWYGDCVSLLMLDLQHAEEMIAFLGGSGGSVSK